MRILVIDDDEVDRQRIQRLMADRHSVLEAELGNEGLGLFLEQQPDCVLLDFMLPDIDGFGLLAELVHHGATVVMLTGQGSEQIAVESMKHGAQDYLAKNNMDSNTLSRTVNNAVQRTAMQRKIEDQQNELSRRAIELERSNQELQQFAYALSHDLQEPLRSISSFCNVLQEHYQGHFDEQADRWMAKIVRGSERMKDMIHDLLVYSRVQSGGASFQAIDCREVLDEVTSDLAIAIRESSATITSDRLPAVLADRSQFAQLLQNLISNAIKYCPNGRPLVHISARRETNEWVFSVEDNGIGIDPEHFNRIFQMFKRLHSHDQYPGNGIGLALCQRIVLRHGGRIWVESQVDQGSTFFFTIPLAVIANVHQCTNRGIRSCQVPVGR